MPMNMDDFRPARPILTSRKSTRRGGLVRMSSMKSTMTTVSMVSRAAKFKETTEAKMNKEIIIGDAVEARLRTIPCGVKKNLGLKELPIHAGSATPALVKIPPAAIKPGNMHGIVLTAHESMIPSLLEFADEFSDVLGRYSLSIPAILEEEFAEIFGANFEFGPMLDCGDLGGDQQISTQIVVHGIGAVVYFVDPIQTTPFHSDTEALERLINVANVLYSSNPTTAIAMMEVLGEGVKGRPELMPSMFARLESPAVIEYTRQQTAVIEEMKARQKGGGGDAQKAKALTGLEQARDEHRAASETKIKHHMRDVVNAVRLMERVNFALHAPNSAAVTLLGAPPPSQRTSQLRISTADMAATMSKPHDQEIGPKDMKCLALISHNHMKPAMQDFVVLNKEVLRKFRLTGTNSTMTMLRSILGDGANFGPACASGPLGGDAQVGAQLCLSDIGGVIFFTDPLSAHPHMADVLALIRLVNVKNVLHATNTATATAIVQVLAKATAGYPELIPSFFHDLGSPAISAMHDNEENDTEFNELAKLKTRESIGGLRQEVPGPIEPLPTITEMNGSRRGSTPREKSRDASFAAKPPTPAPAADPAPAAAPSVAASRGMDDTTKALFVGVAVVGGATLVMTIGGLVVVSVMLLRTKR